MPIVWPIWVGSVVLGCTGSFGLEIALKLDIQTYRQLHKHTDRRIDRWRDEHTTDKQTEVWTYRQADRGMNRQTHRFTDRQIDIQTEKYENGKWETERERFTHEGEIKTQTEKK